MQYSDRRACGLARMHTRAQTANRMRLASAPCLRAMQSRFAYSSYAMQYPTRIHDIAINAIGLSGIRSECTGRRARISLRRAAPRREIDYGGHTRAFYLSSRETALSFAKQFVENIQHMHTYTEGHLARVFNFFPRN